jgi:hypothetical protein
MRANSVDHAELSLEIRRLAIPVTIAKFPAGNGRLA